MLAEIEQISKIFTAGSMGVGDKPEAQRWLDAYQRMVPNDPNARRIQQRIAALP